MKLFNAQKDLNKPEPKINTSQGLSTNFSLKVVKAS